MSSIHLKYWPGRGLMEVPRVCLAIAGKFPGADYTDGRYGAPPEGLETNLGRMPCLETPAGSVGQSAAINFYVASECGLMGSNTLEAAQIIGICEHVKEMVTTWRTLCPYGQEPDMAQLGKWFSDGATDVSGPADGTNRASRYLKWFSGRIEATLGAGFAVGGKLSLADVMLYNQYAEVLTVAERGDSAAWKCEPFYSAEKTSKLLESYPKIAACCASVSMNANVQKWLSTRGPQGF